MLFPPAAPVPDMSSPAKSFAPASVAEKPAFAGPQLAALVGLIREPLDIVEDQTNRCTGLIRTSATRDLYRIKGQLGAVYPEWLGDRRFGEAHGCRFPCIEGEMARGLATPAMVIASARHGFLGFYGAAGLETEIVRSAVREIARETEKLPWGANLIHSPYETGLERATLNMYRNEGVRRVSASAFMSLTPGIVKYAFRGAHWSNAGRIVRPNHVFAKVSRPEVAAHFIAPPPKPLLDELVRENRLTPTEVDVARYAPVAEDITAEADSGGHTDNRPLSVLLPLLTRERDRAGARGIRVGAAGGLGTPAAVAAAFTTGAAYVMTGTVNQTALESGLSEAGRRMLLDAGMADFAMAPSAQVPRKGSLYPQRAARLYDIYRPCQCAAEIPAPVRESIKREIFRRSLADVETDVHSYFSMKRPEELRRAAGDPHRKMALIFRWYLAISSRWPITGQEDRQLDYQIWCGPAIGAFQ